ncbi:hypothetical protein EYF80_040605 [Liparis tanakae]|uniref:Uncharacterized protein n=1 Tax=Liparis tanakae TaxID=230148 RepID=A0A4Z2G6J7_9TELE|nr:hypothetical protein EYF80_040605 [Liparis tanakae]
MFLVTGQPVDPAFSENQAELGIPVLQMLPDCDSLFDEVVQILRQIRGQTLGLQDPQDLVASDETNLSHTMGIPQNHTWTTLIRVQFLSLNIIKTRLDLDFTGSLKLLLKHQLLIAASPRHSAGVAASRPDSSFNSSELWF